MCDTVVIVRSGGVLFAKNSDRDANEAQVLEWQPRHTHAPGSTVRCTWIEIPQVAETHAVLLSRPFWMFGAEMGTNDHGVTIGNEAVFTRQPYARTGLTGMDLLRLALERAATAREAADVITLLLERHGQGGGCGLENRAFTYHNSFLVADPGTAFLVETAGRHWHVEEIRDGARTISNGLTTAEFARRYADPVKTWAAGANARQCRTHALASRASGVGDLMRLLRDHGANSVPPRYSWFAGGLAAPCVHGGGLVANSQTTASWVAELRPGDCSHWATATAAPCTGLFKPVRVDEPVPGLGNPTATADAQSLWWRHERLHRAVMHDPARLLTLYAAERDEVEQRFIAAPPSSIAAFAEGDRLLADWTARVTTIERLRDHRPPWARRYWSKRERWAEG